MDVKSAATDLVKMTLRGTLATAAMTGAGALTAPILGVPALTGAVFVGTYAVTAQTVGVIADLAFKAVGLNKADNPVKHFVCHLAAGVVAFGAGLGAAVGITSALGMPVTLGAGCGVIALASLAVFVTGVALLAIGAGVILTAAVITYLVLKDSEKRQLAFCDALRTCKMPTAADKVWNSFHPDVSVA